MNWTPFQAATIIVNLGSHATKFNFRKPGKNFFLQGAMQKLFTSGTEAFKAQKTIFLNLLPIIPITWVSMSDFTHFSLLNYHIKYVSRQIKACYTQYFRKQEVRSCWLTVVFVASCSSPWNQIWSNKKEYPREIFLTFYFKIYSLVWQQGRHACNFSDLIRKVFFDEATPANG